MDWYRLVDPPMPQSDRRDYGAASQASPPDRLKVRLVRSKLEKLEHEPRAANGIQIRLQVSISTHVDRCLCGG